MAELETAVEKVPDSRVERTVTISSALGADDLAPPVELTRDAHLLEEADVERRLGGVAGELVLERVGDVVSVRRAVR